MPALARSAVTIGVEQLLPSRSGQPLQGLLEVHGRTVAFVAGQLQVVGHRIDDGQTAAVLGSCGHSTAGQSTCAEPLLAHAAAVLDAAGIDHLDDALPVPGAHLHLVLLAGPGVLYDVRAGLAESA